MKWLWLLILLSLLGVFCYVFIVQRVRLMTRTPAWLLWLVVMLPAICMTLWVLVLGGQTPIPTPLGLLLIIGCFVLYVYLIQRGRLPSAEGRLRSSEQNNNEEASGRSNAEGLSEALPEAPFVPPVRSLTSQEEEDLRRCFPREIYALNNIEYRPQAVICRGRLQGPPDDAYQTVEENIRTQFGNRFFLVFQEGPSEKPFFALVPNPQGDFIVTPQVIQKPLLAIMLAIFTALMVTWSGQQLWEQVGLKKDPEFWDGLPYTLALMGFFLIREGGHYWTTLRYKIPATLPYFIPIVPLPQLPIGTIGAFIQIRSPIPNRKALFDVGVIGAVMGLLVAVGMLTYGLSQSQVIALPPGFRPSVFKFEAMLPQYSVLLTILSKLSLGADLGAKMVIKMHPVAVAGWLGVLFTAFNLMPVGQLDGGRMVHAIFGQRQGAGIGQIGRLALLFLALIQPHLLLWAVLLFFLPAIDEPALNDVTELDNWRDGIGLAVLAILLIIIVPAPKALLTVLGMN